MTKQVTYRKTKQGEWVVCGPVGTVRPGQVTVTKRDGTTKTETVLRVGKPFKQGHSELVYGYLTQPQPQRRSRSGECPECGEIVDPGTRCWETGLTHP